MGLEEEVWLVGWLVACLFVCLFVCSWFGFDVVWICLVCFANGLVWLVVWGCCYVFVKARPCAGRFCVWKSRAMRCLCVLGAAQFFFHRMDTQKSILRRLSLFEVARKDLH